MSNNKIKKDKNKIGGKKRVVAAVCAIVLALAVLSFTLYPMIMSVRASDVDDAKAALDKAKAELEDIKNEKADLVAEYASFDAELTAVEDQVAALSSAIENTKEEIALKEEELAEAEQNTNAYKEEFKTRARIMYENGSTSYLEVLFGATSFGDFVEKVEIIGSIINYDREVLNRFVANQLVIKNAKTEMENLLARQEADQSSLSYRQEEIEVLLEKQQAMIDKLLEDEDTAAKAYAAAEKKYEEAERQAQEEMRRQMASGNYTYSGTYSGGTFAWPVPSSSRITSNFGYRIHPISKVRSLHRGVDIGASYGADIVAAEDGVVTIAKYNSSYGRYIVINHGNGYTTLYAHNSQLLVSVGQKVSRGQVIAKAGSTGNSTGPHCHFEVSYNGTLQNPLNYLK